MGSSYSFGLLNLRVGRAGFNLTISRALGRPLGNQSSELGEGLLGFVALIVLPDEFAVVHAPLVRVAHVVVGAGVLTVQTLTEEVIFYFYGAG